MSDPQIFFHHLLDYRSREQLHSMDDRARHQLLLELLKQEPSQKPWLAICELFVAWPEGEVKEQALLLADQALDAWDDRLRYRSSSWGHLYAGGQLAPLARLARSIDIHRREQEGTRELWAIANSEHARNLKHLTIVRSDLSHSTVKALADSPYLTNLQSLAISDSGLMSEDIENLFQAKGLTNLRSLKITDESLGPEQLRYISKSIPFSNLTEVNLSRNSIKSEGLKILSQAPWLATIEKLELANNYVQDDGVNALRTSPYVNSLKLLDLSENPLTEAGKKTLLEMANQKGFSLII